MDDWKKMIRWALQRWYIFAISIFVCVVIGVMYYRFSPSVYRVSASLMLRQQSEKNAQDQLIGMMGFGGDKSTIDEVEVLTSSMLMEQVVESMHLRTLYYRRINRQWKNLYPDLPFTLVVPDGCTNLRAILKVDEGKYSLRVEDSHGKKSEATITDLRQPFKTHLGDLRVVANKEIEEGKYRVDYLTTEWAVQEFQSRVDVSRSSRESRVIHLTSTTADDVLMRDVIGRMLDIYHRESASDKNVLARETQTFLDERIAVVANELDSAEVALEAYKRAHHIANLDVAAESYRANSDMYEQRVAQMDADIAILDLLAKQLREMDENYTVLPSNTAISDRALAELISIFNTLVLSREKLLQTALPGNPSLDSKTEQVSHTRRELLTAIEQSRQSALLTRENARRQRDGYAARLQATPEQERRYQEMLRERNAKEKQYNFLVESREENSLLLASQAMPVKIIERPTIHPKRVSPKLLPILIVALLVGLILPLVWYFLAEMRTLLVNPAPVASTKENIE